ncbi:MAG: hypothetical protein H6548_05605 [Chitinophagales bacterium]|nr:hypothetical protein [Chitinophagales bacterium]HAE14399.1 hypothetical protein [Bacteroidota bacterium]MCB9021573.1 hypothetical protein [Chitinophagales bacterium]MCB9031174.1 hypothetical protein [Chitinophagales bacterium]HAE36134.1 hypothetical protein [Bacteroidota bacterium]
MKKLSLLFGVLFVAAATLSSCQKCTVCTHIELSTGEEVVEEYCGSGGEVGRFEDEWKSNWDSLGGYCTRDGSTIQ